jgi:hypothetical protein
MPLLARNDSQSPPIPPGAAEAPQFLNCNALFLRKRGGTAACFSARIANLVPLVKIAASILRPCLPLALLFTLASCATLRHQFTQPAPDWQTRSGQLQYRGPKTSLIGDVLVRYDSAGDLELTFSKGPGVVLLTVRQDPNFVRVSGPLARGSWSGPPANAPVHLRGWVSLREVLLREKTQPLIRQKLGADSFTFAF